VVLEGTLDQLMQEVGRQELMDICSGEIAGEWLKNDD
jgi:hypothetical protein